MDNAKLEIFSGSCELALAPCYGELWCAMMFCKELGTHFGISGVQLFATTLENPGFPLGLQLASN